MFSEPRLVLSVMMLFAGFIPLKEASAESAEMIPVRLLENVAPGNCAACHENQRVLPLGHKDTVTMEIAGCIECHEEGETNLRTKIPLNHTHRLNGIGCLDCHDDLIATQSLTTECCLSCHDSHEAVAKNTTNHDPNPHNSPHYGLNLDCDLCHHQHSKSENFCAQCHEWQLEVP